MASVFFAAVSPDQSSTASSARIVSESSRREAFSSCSAFSVVLSRESSTATPSQQLATVALPSPSSCSTDLSSQLAVTSRLAVTDRRGAPSKTNNGGGKRKYKSRKGKEAAGASEHVGADGVDPTALLPTAVVTANIETGLPADHFVPDEVRVDEAGRQL
ncbi:hypothetical protein Bca101_067940 [Brassica carinata]